MQLKKAARRHLAPASTTQTDDNHEPDLEGEEALESEMEGGDSDDFRSEDWSGPDQLDFKLRRPRTSVAVQEVQDGLMHNHTSEEDPKIRIKRKRGGLLEQWRKSQAIIEERLKE